MPQRDDPHDDDFPAPRLTWRVPDARRLPALEPYADVVGRVPHVIVRETVWDTSDGVLAAAGIDLVRSEDGTWTIDRGDGPEHLADRTADAPVPELAVYLRGRPLTVVRRRDTTTALLVLHSRDGRVRAEVADVRVDEGAPGEPVLRVGRWWALADDGSEHALVRGVERAMLDAAEDSKDAEGTDVARTDTASTTEGDERGAGLSEQSPVQVPRGAPVRRPAGVRRPRSGTAARFVVDALATLRADVVRIDPLVRRGEPDALHAHRGSLRRIRSVLAVFRGALDRDATEAVRRSLGHVGRAAGVARDAEVLAATVRSLADRAPLGLVDDAASAGLLGRLATAHREAVAGFDEVLRSAEWFDALDALDALIADAPPGPRAGDAVRPFVERRLHRERRRMRRARDTAAARAGDLEVLHDARKAARRLRYGVEAVGGSVAGHQHLGRLRKVQAALGDGLDAAHAVAALQLGTDFTAGVLATVGRQRADRRFRRGRELLARL
ncbi:CHAD domain-containing protein [Curtobacterium sp. MCLR17_032]|uniref:CHAD domain-containing protein n=1 Tax=Curtobacterium sp. MCLR17_032 TaxID=2175650 RepID=UPI000DAA0600|nr:CHAD domain-containing protein [Curtobacterium sp. MCLR17_032]WIE60989.1 CHAD domain-containing protein [Curtobacterium sp. MCLR17_032]